MDYGVLQKDMKLLPLIFVLVALLSGCSGQAVRTFNEQGLDEQELATIAKYEEGGLFGTSMYFKSVDGKKVRGYFDKSVDSVKVTPGKHTFEVEFHDNSFSLFSDDQHLKIAFEFDVVSGHHYTLHFDMDKSIAQRFTFGGNLVGWMQDNTTGEKHLLSRPGRE